MELLTALGINYKIFIAQFINFAVLLFVLWKFAYKPILKFLKERADKIEQGVKNADTATAKLAEIEEKEKAVLVKAKKEAAEILEEAKKRAEAKGQEIVNKAKEDIGQIINVEKSKMKQEKEETLRQLKGEMAELITMSLEKILDEKVDNAKDREIINKVVKEIK